MIRRDGLESLPVVFSAAEIQETASLTSDTIDQGDAVAIVLTSLLTFNVAATAGATVEIFQVNPEGEVDTYASFTYSIPYVSGAQVHTEKIEIGSQKFKVKITNDDAAEDITAMTAGYIRMMY